MLNEQDQQTLRNMAANSVAEIALAQLAMQQGNSEEVKRYGQRIMDDHSMLNAALANMARQQEVALSDTLTPQAKALHDHLTAKAGGTFDREYLSQMADTHQRMMLDLLRAVSGIQNDELRRLAEQVTTVLEDHYNLAVASKASLEGSGPRTYAGR